MSKTFMVPKGTNMPQSLTDDQRKEKQQHVLKVREAAKASMNKDLLKAAIKVESIFDSWVDRQYKARWELGKYLKEVRDNEGKYQADAIRKMSDYLQCERSILDKSIHFYTDFNDENLAKLIEGRMKVSTSHITWQHIEILMTVEDDTTRYKFLDSTYENDWTPDELDRAYRALTGQLDTPKHAGGRPLRIPATFSARLENFNKVAGVILRNELAIWRNKEHGFVNSVKEIPADRLNQDILDKFDENIDLADKMIEAATRVKEEMEEARDDAQAKMQVPDQVKP